MTDTGGTGAWVGFELTDAQREFIRKRTGRDAGAIYLTFAELMSGRFAVQSASDDANVPAVDPQA